MTELIIGVALGAVGMYAKDKFLGNSETNKLNAKKENWMNCIQKMIKFVSEIRI